jgi:hypothetical protein
MALPPPKQRLNPPAERINKGDFFGRQVLSICSDPVDFASNAQADEIDRVTHSVVFISHPDLPEEKDAVALYEGKGLNQLPPGILLQPSNEMFIRINPFIESLMILISTVNNTSLPDGEEFADEGTFGTVSGRQGNSTREIPIQRQPNMDFHLIGRSRIVRPCHYQ